MKFWISVSFTDPAHLVPLARKAEEVGFEGVLMADHLFYPEDIESSYPYSPDGTPLFAKTTPFPEPWCAISAMAAVTERLKFSVAVYILPLHDPIEVAKQTSTVAAISGGRLALGIGTGWMKEEFDIQGIPFETRGRRMNEQIEVLRKLWSGKPVSHEGEFFEFPEISMSPAASFEIPIWVGGSSKIALRRAARLAQGWIGHGHDEQSASAVLDTLARLRAEEGRAGDSFECLVPLAGEPEDALFTRMAQKGMTATLSYPPSLAIGAESPTLEQECDHLEQYAENVIEPLRKI